MAPLKSPLRERVKRTVTVKSPSQPPKQGSPPSESEWTVVNRKSDKKRGCTASSGGGNSSASETDSNKPPPRKLASRPKGSTPLVCAPVPDLKSSRDSDQKQKKSSSDINVPAPPTSDFDINIAPSKAAEAPPKADSPPIETPATAAKEAQFSTSDDASEKQTEQEEPQTGYQSEQELPAQPDSNSTEECEEAAERRERIKQRKVLSKKRQQKFIAQVKAPSKAEDQEDFSPVSIESRSSLATSGVLSQLYVSPKPQSADRSRPVH
ncbi:hypothetical protein EC991_008322, partial [Linnemannia zychae]